MSRPAIHRRRPETGLVPRSAPLAAVLLGAFCAAGCVSAPTDPDADFASSVRPIVVSLPTPTVSGDDRALHEFYRGLLRRLHVAYSDRDLPMLRALLAGYSRDRAPDWARELMDGFAAVTGGLAFELHCRDRAELAADGPSVLGTVLRLELRIPAVPGTEIALGGEGDATPLSFSVTFSVQDDYPDGSLQSHSGETMARLPRTVKLSGDGLRVPLELDLGAFGAVRRVVAAEVIMLPGFVRGDGLRSPVRRTPLGRVRVVQYPAGYEVIREKPLATLREAMRRGDPEHFPHVWLAASFAPGSDRETVLEALIDWVRLGRPDQQRVAMAALAHLTDAPAVVGDRESWLAWWQERR